MPIVFDDVEYITPEEACKMFALHPNTIDSWYMKTKHEKMDMPYIMNPCGKLPKGYRLREGCRPNYLLPMKKFFEWINAKTTDKQK